jgi:dihydrofolate reductase
MKCSVFIACSLDGFIARKNYSLDWLTSIPNEIGTDFGYNRFMQNIDAIIMGRNSFETALKFDSWPYSKPVCVLSRTLHEIPARLRESVSIRRDDVKDILGYFERQHMEHLYIDGGKTIQTFLKEDLIDEMFVTTSGRLLGSGIPLFGTIGREIDFEILSTKRLNPYLSQTVYVRNRNFRYQTP